MLLDVPLGPPEVLLGVGAPPVLGVHLRLELANAGLHLGHRLLASLEGVLLGLVDPVLGVLHLGLEQLLVPLQGHGSLLLHAQLICKTSRIDHGTLSLLLGKMRLSGHLVQVVAHGAHLLLALHLRAADRLVCASLVAQALVRVRKLLLHHAAVAVSLLQKSPGLLESVLVGISPPVRGDQVVRGDRLGPALLLETLLHVADVALDQADVALALGVGSVGVLEGNSEVDNIGVELLLHAKSLNLALGLGLKSHLHALDGLAEVLPGRGEFLLFLGDPPLNLLLDLGQLEGGAQHLVLLLLKSSLSLTEGGLQLHLLGLQALPDLVDLVDGASTLADLVHDVLDLVGQDLVLATDLLQLEDGLIIGVLDAEEFRRNVASLLLGDVQVHAKTVHLVLPLANNPIELLGLLLHGSVQDLGLVELLGHVGGVGGGLGLGLLQLLQLQSKLFDGGLALAEPGLQLHLGHLELLGLGNSFNLVLLFQSVSHVFHVAELAQQADSLLGLVVGDRLLLVEGAHQGGLGLRHQARVGGQLLQLAEQVRVLGGDSSLALLEVAEVEVHLLDLLAQVGQGGRQGPLGLLSRSLAPSNFISCCPHVLDLSHGVSLLLLQADQGSVVLDSAFLQVLPQLRHLALPLLVQFHLGRGSSTGLVQPLPETFHLASKIGSLALRLGASLTFGLELLFHLLDAALRLLDRLLHFANEGLFVFQL